MKVNAGTIISVVLAILFATVLFKMLPSLIPSIATSVHNLSDTLSGDGDLIGTEAAAFAGEMDSLTGWFWVIGPMVLVILVAVSLFKTSGRRGRRFRRR